MLQKYNHTKPSLSPEWRLPIAFLRSYLFFLTRRPISKSNTQYLSKRINGLKSLTRILQCSNDPFLNHIVHQLNILSPVNFSRIATQLLTLLANRLKNDQEVPKGFIFSNNSPSKDFIAEAQHILLILGPGIGIGDEIMFFPVPMWIKTSFPHTRITILSAYEELWERVKGIDDTIYYSDYLTVLKALRGEEPFEKYDIVMLADFEKANLFTTISHEPGIHKYIEISTGTYSAAAVDNKSKWICQMQRPEPYFSNYYYSLTHLLQWIGITPEPAEQFSCIIRHTNDCCQNTLTIFVSPFTSKYDPSQSYWSHLLASVFPDHSQHAVRFVLDTGPNLTTERFASQLQRSVKGRILSNIHVDLARSDGQRTLSLKDVFREMEKSHVVICADSFTAHAAPFFGCITLVIGSVNLLNWHVPFGLNYFFRAEDTVDEVAAGMRQVLINFNNSGFEHPFHFPFSDLGRQIQMAIKALQKHISNTQRLDPASLYKTYNAFIDSYKKIISCLTRLPDEFYGLLNDFAYENEIFELSSKSFQKEEFFPDLIIHIQDQLNQWQNTNLQKYLNMVVNGGAEHPIGRKNELS